MARLTILTEDSYGIDFFNKLCARLKKDGLMERSVGIRVETCRTPCNDKVRRVILARMMSGDARIIVFTDADGEDPSVNISKIQSHLTDEMKTKTRLIAHTFEIEEWLCDNLGLEYSRDDRPSDVMKRERDYKKYQLPDYADRLDLGKLGIMNRSFREFFAALKNI